MFVVGVVVARLIRIQFTRRIRVAHRIGTHLPLVVPSFRSNRSRDARRVRRVAWGNS